MSYSYEGRAARVNDFLRSLPGHPLEVRERLAEWFGSPGKVPLRCEVCGAGPVVDVIDGDELLAACAACLAASCAGGAA